MTSAPRLSRVSTAIAFAIALSATPALAGGPAFLKLGGVEGESQDDKHKNQIEILSWSWGATQTSHGTGAGGMGAGKVSKIDAISIKQGTQAQGEKGGTEDINIGVGELQEAAAANDRLRSAGPKDGWPAAQAGEAEITLKGAAAAEEAKKRPGRVKYGDITLKRGATESAEAGGGVSVAAGDVDGDGRAEAAKHKSGSISYLNRTRQKEIAGSAGANETVTVGSNQTEASGLPTGKRQHKPFTVTKELDKATPAMALAAPLPQGSVRVKVKMPWLACQEGARFPELQLAEGGRTYKLKDAIVSSCAAAGDSSPPMEEISFNYAKIEF